MINFENVSQIILPAGEVRSVSIDGNKVWDKYPEVIQMVPNGNFEHGIDSWRTTDVTISAENNICTITTTVSPSLSTRILMTCNTIVDSTHKILYCADVYPSIDLPGHRMGVENWFTGGFSTTANTWNRMTILARENYGADGSVYIFWINNYQSYTIPVGTTVMVKNLMAIDLTQMFGAGKEISAQEFRQIYTDDYYPCNV